MAKLWFLGEALIDFVAVPAPDGGPAFAPRCGGSPFNAAKAAARAGAEVGFLGALSTDLFGQMLEADLRAEGVDVTHAPRLDAPTTLAFVDLQAGEPRYAFFNEATATRMAAFGAAAAAPAPGDVVGFGSISLIDLPGAEAIAAVAQALAGRAMVALDPNARPGMTADPAAWRARIGRMLEVAGLVRLSEEDLAFLAPGMGAADFAAVQLARGAGLVVVTHGARGAVGFAPGVTVSVPGVAVDVVDTVGAGDTLMGVLLAGLVAGGHTGGTAPRGLDSARLGPLLRQAVAAAALNCTRSGCAPPDVAERAAFVAARGLD
jgi:fructokinase